MIQLYMYVVNGGERMIKAIVFDLDHTLFDRYESLRLVVPRFKEGFSIAEGISDEYIYERICWADKNFVHKGWQGIHAHLCECGIFSEEPTYEEYCRYVVSLLKRMAVPYPFTNDVLSEIRAQGFKMGIITNGENDTQNNKIDVLGIRDYFDSIVISGDTPYSKPDEGIFRLMADKLRVDVTEMMYVGDHPKFDVDGSRNAGCTPVWVRTTGTWIFPEIEKPLLQVDSVAELPAITKEINLIKV